MITIDKTSNNLNNIDIPFIPQSWVIWYNWTCLQVGKLIPIQHATTTGLKADKMSDKILNNHQKPRPFFQHPLSLISWRFPYLEASLNLFLTALLRWNSWSNFSIFVWCRCFVSLEACHFPGQLGPAALRYGPLLARR